MALLQIEQLSKKFYEKHKPPHVVLDRISFEVEAGQFVSLLGPSGCGKTTLLTILGGFLPANSGRIVLSGREVKEPGLDRGFVFQNYALFPWMSVQDNILYSLQVQGCSKAEQKQRLSELLTMSHLQGSERKYPIQLSGGMQQRVAVVRALASHPEILLLDEPLGAIDFQMRELLQGELSSLVQDTGATVLMVTHDVNEAVYMSDRVIVMSSDRGQIVEDVAIKLARPRDRESLDFRSYVDHLSILVRRAFYAGRPELEQHQSMSRPARLDISDGVAEAYLRRVQ